MYEILFNLSRYCEGKMPEKSQSRAIIADPTPATNIVAELGWAKGPRGGAKPPQKWAIRRALRTKAQEFSPLYEYY